MASRFLLFLALLSLLATEEAVVLGLKKSLNSTSRLYWNDSDPCKGKNVRDNQVVRIQIGRQNLGGFLPSNINELTSLQVFEVQDSQIGGSLPSLAGLNSLQTLNNTKFSAISWDFFNGTTSLQSVNLEHNPFTSLEILESLESVPALQMFSASDTNLTRVLPEIFGLDSYPPVDVLTMPRRSLLSFNILTGTIPSTLLDVSDDNIDGEVPAFSSSVTVRDGNVNIGTDRSDGSPAVAILGSLLVVLCVVIGVLVFFLCRAKVEPSSHVTNAGSSLDGETRGISIMGSSSPRELQLVKDDCLVFSVQVLKIATDNFNDQNILGRGGFGSVYKGELNDGTKIAVKKMKPGLTSSKGLELFESEISAHTKVRHINLVKLLGYCINGSERHLVFELMTQGTLSRFLFNWKNEGLKPLEWRKRLGIALDVARGVEYLHGFAGKSFIHRDLKPSNILLGDDMRAKVADFGLMRHVPPDGEASTASKFVGTFGYIAPEYAETGRVSTKMDVYSFGVVLMELITGRKALDTSLPEEKQHIVAWFRSMLISKGTDAFPNAIDPNLDLNEEDTLSSIITVAELADYCSSGESNQRPCMSHVVYVLSSQAGVWKPTKSADPQDSDGINHSMIFAEMIRDGRLLKECSLGNWNSILGTNDDIETIITN